MSFEPGSERILKMAAGGRALPGAGQFKPAKVITNRGCHPWPARAVITIKHENSFAGKGLSFVFATIRYIIAGRGLNKY